MNQFFIRPINNFRKRNNFRIPSTHSLDFPKPMHLSQFIPIQKDYKTPKQIPFSKLGKKHFGRESSQVVQVATVFFVLLLPGPGPIDQDIDQCIGPSIKEKDHLVG